MWKQVTLSVCLFFQISFGQPTTKSVQPTLEDLQTNLSALWGHVHHLDQELHQHINVGPMMHADDDLHQSHHEHEGHPYHDHGHDSHNHHEKHLSEEDHKEDDTNVGKDHYHHAHSNDHLHPHDDVQNSHQHDGIVKSHNIGLAAPHSQQFDASHSHDHVHEMGGDHHDDDHHFQHQHQHHDHGGMSDYFLGSLDHHHHYDDDHEAPHHEHYGDNHQITHHQHEDDHHDQYHHHHNKGHSNEKLHHEKYDGENESQEKNNESEEEIEDKSRKLFGQEENYSHAGHHHHHNQHHNQRHGYPNHINNMNHHTQHLHSMKMAFRRMVEAHCHLLPNVEVSESNVTGHVTIKQKKDNRGPTYFEISLNGFEISKNGVTQLHGFHIHENEIVDEKCSSAGGHFNPTNKNHGGPSSDERHIGDLGNVPVNKNGLLENYVLSDYIANLGGPNSIIGKSIVIHQLEDDIGQGGNEESLRTGNAGARLSCCTIHVKQVPILTRTAIKFNR